MFRQRPSVLSQSILDNSPGGASRLAALLVAYILPVCALLAPCQPGAALRIIGNSWLGQDTRIGDCEYSSAKIPHQPRHPKAEATCSLPDTRAPRAQGGRRGAQ